MRWLPAAPVDRLTSSRPYLTGTVHGSFGTRLHGAP